MDSSERREVEAIDETEEYEEIEAIREKPSTTFTTTDSMNIEQVDVDCLAPKPMKLGLSKPQLMVGSMIINSITGKFHPLAKITDLEQF